MDDTRQNLVIGMAPDGITSAPLCAAVSAAGGLGVVDLGTAGREALAALTHAAELASGQPFGIRVSGDCGLSPRAVFDALGARAASLATVVLSWDAPWQISELPEHCRALVEVTSWQEALVAVERGADGLIGRGSETGGRVGESGAFVLLQRLLAEDRVSVPVWIRGGIGPHTAAAAVCGGAAGVVLDSQLALLPEADLPDDVVAAIAASDGTNTSVDGDQRVLVSRHYEGTLAVGQDAFLATRFERTYGSVARAVRATVAAVHDAVRAKEQPGHAEGSPMAGTLGTRLPVAQGPMTRVSDQAGFAAAVAEQGALPFIALALSSAQATRTLLEQTRAELGSRPWGVGVLGFAAEEIRTAQLEVIRDVKPSTVLIAGGRPDQARALEAEGISTFLHVPSPGLLEQYLAAGARKFVFEGSECGGHVGPRTCFTLWEAQLGVLLDFVKSGGAAEELRILFAGGIHDARSSAMVAALSAPLARQGASVGILMGTAYLFTQEAVVHNAVGEVFQRQVLAAQQTELLETAPGHATRCVASPFTDAFRTTAEELGAQGVDQREIWQRLEELNVGRLRIASKGLTRDGDQLVGVAEPDQLDLGLFMAGQVATLRSAVTTVAALHEEVTAGSLRFAEERAALLRAEFGLVVEPEPVRPLDIAIVGMAGVYPGAADLTEFWANVIANVDSVTEVSHDRWDPAIYYADPATKDGPPRGDWTPSKWGGFLPEIQFDPLRYGIPPNALAAIDPAQLLALYVAERALADAGCTESGFDRSRTGVVFATAQGSDLKNANTLRMTLPSYFGSLPEEFDEQLPTVSEDTLPGQLGSVVAGRIANRLDLGGMNFTIDAACASSLAAIDSACKELVNGNADVMLAGAADTHNSVEDFLLFGSVGALSASGRCRTFDSTADGIALSEGVSCVVLKRLSDAERDGDRVYAVIKGVGGGSDGKALGLTAPRPDGQRRALARAYRAAGVSPAQVGLVEAHGTGTVVGDRTELETLTKVFDEAGAEPASCVLGSVKSQIGHTKCAAGLAGLMKVALSVYTGVKPPTLGITAPNPAWRAEESPFVFHDSAAPWSVPPEQRVAGVSAFGFGGTNFHVVVGGHRSAGVNRHGLRRWPAELFTFHGADDEAARRQIDKLRALVETNAQHGEPWSLADLARTTAARAGRAPVRVAVVARNLDELDDLLRAAADGETDPNRGIFRVGEPETTGKLAVLFPGQGSQRPGMLAELFVAFPELQHASGLAEAALDPAGKALVDAMFPPAAFDPDAIKVQERRLRDTRMAQPALGVAGLAANHLLRRAGVVADMYAGHSYGELVALAATGAFTASALRALSSARAESILSAAGRDPGTMAAVAAGADKVERVLAENGLSGRVVVANRNAPRQVVISGETALVEVAQEALRTAGFAAKGIPVACAFHSPVIAGAGTRFAEVLARHDIAAPERPVWTNRSASTYPADPADIAAELAAQVGSPVRFVEQIEAMYADGARVFVEAGPGQVLSGLVGKILGDRPHTVIGFEGSGRRGVEGFLRALAQLAVSGANASTAWLFIGREARDVSQETPKPRAGWTVDGHVVRAKNGQLVTGGLIPARPIDLSTSSQVNGSVEVDRDTVITEFLRTSRELIATQRDVLQAYFGGDVAVSASDWAAHQETEEFAQAGQSLAVANPDPAPLAGSGGAAVAPAAAGAGQQDVLTTVISVIARRTGYPVEMISPELDLEADLSIDSIKRTEIAGELTSVLEFDDQDAVPDLVKARTAAELAGLLRGSADEVVPSGGAVAGQPVTEPAASGAVGAAVASAADGALVQPPIRHVLQLLDVAAGGRLEPAALVGSNVVIAGGGALAEAVADCLSARGAMPFVVGGVAELDGKAGRADVVISLHAMEPEGDPVLPGWFPLFRSALELRPACVLAAAPAGAVVPRRAAGLRGFFRSVSKEYPEVVVRLVEVDAGRGLEAVADDVVAELFLPGPDPVVIRDGDRRQRLAMVRSELSVPESGGTGVVDAVSQLGLTGDSVVLLVGGGRGITAQVAQALATGSGCRIELAGRTQLSAEPEDPSLASATDLPALRGAIARLGGTAPSAIDRAAREILSQREVAATVAELSALGSAVGYHCVDARDPESIRRLVKEIHAEHGRIDGVVYAAGIVDDRLVADKDATSFNAVFGTKVGGAEALLAELDLLPSRPPFVVFFGSIVAVQGNRGQSDYAAANDALDTLGGLSVAEHGGRILTVHWGPWAPAAGHRGMISAELSRNYADRGIALGDPEESVACLLRELAWGQSGAGSVVYTASGW